MGWGTRRVTSTTMVLVILAETTSPTFSFLLPIFFLTAALSAMAYFPFFFFLGVGSGAVSGCSSRSRRMVRIRARSLRMFRSFFNPSLWPMLNWKRRRKFCSRISAACLRSSSLSSSRTLSALIAFLPGEFPRSFAGIVLAAHYLGRQRQLARGQPKSFLRGRFRNAFHFKQDLARPDHRHPLVGRAFALAHTSLRRFLRNRLVRKQADPNLAATLDEARHRDTSRLNLPVRDPAATHGFQPEFAKSEAGAAPRFAGHAAALLFPVFNLLWHQHGDVSPLSLPFIFIRLDSRRAARFRRRVFHFFFPGWLGRREWWQNGRDPRRAGVGRRLDYWSRGGVRRGRRK